MSSNLRLGLPKDFFPAGVGLPVKILKALLPFSILATRHVHLNLLDLITLIKLGEVRANKWRRLRWAGHVARME